jgi:hypothetical protein
MCGCEDIETEPQSPHQREIRGGKERWGIEKMGWGRLERTRMGATHGKIE